MDIVTYALLKKYVQDTVEGAGGLQGEPGKSAYEIAVDAGYSGTEQEWLAGLQGKDGVVPHIGDNGNWFLDDEDTGISATSLNDEVSSNITVELGVNGTLGGYKTGDVISTGTSIETIVKKLLAKQVPPTYTAPTVQIANNNGTVIGQYEYGTLITPKLTTIFHQNDAGSLTTIAIFKNGNKEQEQNVSPLSYNGETFTLSSAVAFKGSVSYQEGAIKNDNLGEPYSAGHIQAGSKDSNSLTYQPYRQGYFWGVLNTSSEQKPLTSAIIRNGQKKNGAYSTGQITGITASIVENRKRIFVACPATNIGITKVIMPSAMNADCTADFVKQNSTIMVEGANGYSPIAYNVWVYEPALISDDQTFTVTLG